MLLARCRYMRRLGCLSNKRPYRDRCERFPVVSWGLVAVTAMVSTRQYLYHSLIVYCGNQVHVRHDTRHGWPLFACTS